MKLHLAPSAERGNATVIAVIVLLVIGSLAGIVVSVAHRNSGEVTALADQNRAFFVAQGGMNAALAELEAGNSAALGSAEVPIEADGGRYWVDVAEDGELFTLTAHARAGLQEESLEVVVRQEQSGVFRNAIFAGNSSSDSAYKLDLSGKLLQADHVQGDVYSGGSVTVREDASVDGIIRAYQSVTGKGSSTAETGTKQAIPDLPGMSYDTTADIKVAQEFATGGATYASSGAGGKAWQLPEANPAHIFRKNPSDRATETAGTTKDDYFLEDPYEKVTPDTLSTGADAYNITLSGVSGEPGKSSNQKVFFIDGNLWIHNYHTLSMKLAHKDAGGVQVTFVVKGNIYIGDNLFYADGKKDGIALIATKDAKVADSGNVYFGDPEFGTIKRMHAYMYAENNFHDNNLDATGSASVELYGNMTAGNHVKINRDFVIGTGKKKVVQHSKLKIDFDERIANGELTLPGLPQTLTDGGGGFEVLSWREIGG